MGQRAGRAETVYLRRRSWAAEYFSGCWAYRSPSSSCLRCSGTDAWPVSGDPANGGAVRLLLSSRRAQRQISIEVTNRPEIRRSARNDSGSQNDEKSHTGRRKYDVPRKTHDGHRSIPAFAGMTNRVRTSDVWYHDGTFHKSDKGAMQWPKSRQTSTTSPFSPTSRRCVSGRGNTFVKAPSRNLRRQHGDSVQNPE